MIIIIYLVKKLKLDELHDYHNKLNNKRELRNYYLTVNYSNKSFGQSVFCKLLGSWDQPSLILCLLSLKKEYLGEKL